MPEPGARQLRRKRSDAGHHHVRQAHRRNAQRRQHPGKRLSDGTLSPAVARIAIAIGAAALAAFAWGSLVERTRWTLRRVDVPVLPAGADPIRVLHLSDLHMAPWQRDKQEWVRSLADLEPDLIVDTGDNLGHERGHRGHPPPRSSRSRGIPGVFVNGSNDYFGPVAKNPFTLLRRPVGHDRRVRSASTSANCTATSPSSAGIDLDNTADHPRPARHALRVLRRRRPAPGLRPPRPHHRGDRRAARRGPARRRGVARRGIREPPGRRSRSASPTRRTSACSTRS